MSSAATGAAVGVTVTILLLGLLGAAGYVYKRRQGRVARINEPDGRRSVVLERSHPASRVTPFAAGYSEPCFRTWTRSHGCIRKAHSRSVHVDHTPGEAMRFARRRSDGGWDFSAPLMISPSGPSPFDSACASPASPMSPAPWYSRKEVLPPTSTNRALLDVDPFGVAPPAYSPRAPSSTD